MVLQAVGTAKLDLKSYQQYMSFAGRTYMHNWELLVSDGEHEERVAPGPYTQSTDMDWPTEIILKKGEMIIDRVPTEDWKIAIQNGQYVRTYAVLPRKMENGMS